MVAVRGVRHLLPLGLHEAPQWPAEQLSGELILVDGTLGHGQPVVSYGHDKWVGVHTNETSYDWLAEKLVQLLAVALGEGLVLWVLLDEGLDSVQEVVDIVDGLEVGKVVLDLVLNMLQVDLVVFADSFQCRRIDQTKTVWSVVFGLDSAGQHEARQAGQL